MIKKLHIDKEAMCYEVSRGRTTSMKEITPEEANVIISKLNQWGKDLPLTDQEKSMKRMRSSIVHYLKLLGYTKVVTDKVECDWDRINAFIENLGSNNPKRKRLNKLSYTELHAVTTQIKAMYFNTLTRKANGKH